MGSNNTTDTRPERIYVNRSHKHCHTPGVTHESRHFENRRGEGPGARLRRRPWSRGWARIQEVVVLSRILPAPRMFRRGYHVNTEKSVLLLL